MTIRISPLSDRISAVYTKKKVFLIKKITCPYPKGEWEESVSFHPSPLLGLTIKNNNKTGDDVVSGNLGWRPACDTADMVRSADLNLIRKGSNYAFGTSPSQGRSNDIVFIRDHFARSSLLFHPPCQIHVLGGTCLTVSRYPRLEDPEIWRWRKMGFYVSRTDNCHPYTTESISWVVAVFIWYRRLNKI